MLLKKIEKDKLKVYIHDTRESMGEHAARDFADYVAKIQKKKKEINIVFAAAPSQNDFLRSLAFETDIDWSKVNVFHMDEYVGIGIDEEQSFAKFVKNHVVDRFPVKNFFPINGKSDDIKVECERYTKLLRKNKIDIVCLGIGENGHIAFNDPGEADFWDSEDVKVVSLDQMCRQQQVNDKCFENIDKVPKKALTITIPALLRADAMFCIVPAQTKEEAINKMINGGIDDMCPATALRIHKCAKLFCDKDSGYKILR